MNNLLLAEYLILFLLFLSCMRVFVFSNPQKDSFSCFPFIAFALSAGDIFLFGYSIIELVFVIISGFVAFWNIKAFLALLLDITPDRFSIRFRIINFLCLGIILTAGHFTVCYRPAVSDFKKMGVKQSVWNLSGGIHSGYHLHEKNQEKINAKIFKIERTEAVPYKTPDIIFVLPKTASVTTYISFMNKLAHDGYNVYTGEFYDEKWFDGIMDMKFMKKRCFQKKRLREQEHYKLIAKYNRKYFIKEAEIILSFIDGDNDIFLVTEEDVSGWMKSFAVRNPRIKGTFDLNFVDDYSTKGFGPVENTDPIIALTLNEKMDRSGYISNHLALELEDFISSQFIAE